MISARFALEHPRLVVRDFLPLLTDPRVNAEVFVDVEVDVDGERTCQQIGLVPQAMPLDRGVRWWALCPRCGARSGHLYPIPDLACRRCAGLQYSSQFERP